MSRLRRLNDPRTTYFITNVTYERRPILGEHADLLWNAITTLQMRSSFDLQAWVFLPDHFHLLIDTRGCNISNLIQRLKMSFSAQYLKRVGLKSGRVWQNRFWDHIIRDQEDWSRHVDYIHYNPAKHGCVVTPIEWQYSSIHVFHEEGLYQENWGQRELTFDGEFGE